MGARRVARVKALQALYQLEQDVKLELLTALEAAWTSEDESQKEPEAVLFATELVEGVKSHLPEIDSLIETHSHHWRLDRMQRIDRNVLRIGVYEILYRTDIPRSVAINEAVELGKAFGTEESSGFINGLLDKIERPAPKS
jgi:transcription antitermination protein NusB